MTPPDSGDTLCPMNIPEYSELHASLVDGLLERFLRYVRIHTTSHEEAAAEKTPSTDGQWDLLKLLVEELKGIGINDVSLNENGYLIARLPGNIEGGGKPPTIGFMAHVDTNADAPGENVNPVIHESYDGNPIELKEGVVLDPADQPLLANYVGKTIVTTDGTTLLGADDKAGIAEIMSAAEWLVGHPEVRRGDIEIVFSPDEETGYGMDRFPVDRLESEFCFTMDGSQEGEVETECYYARSAIVSFKGHVIHPGTARGKLVNAVTMASAFVSMLPRNESPEATDGRYGNYWPHKIEGGLESAELHVPFRSFDLDDIDRREEALRAFGKAVEAAFPGGRVEMKFIERYRNMREELDKHPQLIEVLREAVRATGIDTIEKPIRGGTDGSKLTAKGIPTPNIFAGGVDFHSRAEWVAVPAMTRAASVILNLVALWSEKTA